MSEVLTLAFALGVALLSEAILVVGLIAIKIHQLENESAE